MNYTIKSKMCRRLAIVLAMLLCLSGTAAFAADGTAGIAYWNATTTMFYAELTGAPDGDLTVSVGDNTNVAATRGTSGDKTTVTANLTTPLALNTWYTAKVSAGSTAVASVEFQLLTLLADDFEKYTDNAAIRAVYKVSNDSYAGVDAENGKMRCRYKDVQAAVYHKDFLSDQAGWQDYTMEFDYFGGTDGTAIADDGEEVTYNGAKNVFLGMEADKNTDYNKTGVGETTKKSSATLLLNAAGAYTYRGRRTDGANKETAVSTASKATDEKVSVQMSTVGSRYTLLLGGKQVFSQPLDAVESRGGGFAFVSRPENKVPSYYFIDNLKMYKPVEKGETKTYTLSLSDATTASVGVALNEATTGILTADIDGAPAKVSGAGAAVTVVPETALTLDDVHTVTLYENGAQAGTLRFRLAGLLADDFDSYGSNAELQENWIAGNGNVAAELEDGKLRLRYVSPGAIYHKDFFAGQSTWQDYTMEFDYIAGKTGATLSKEGGGTINGTYNPPNHVRIGMETSGLTPAELQNVGIDGTLGKSAATVLLGAKNLRTWIGVPPGGSQVYDSGDSAAINGHSDLKLRLSIKDNRVITCVNGGQIANNALSAKVARGGGMVFISRAEGGVPSYFYIDNFKAYRAIDLNAPKGELTVTQITTAADGCTVTCSQPVTREPGDKLALLHYADGKITTAPSTLAYSKNTVSVTPDEALADGMYAIAVRAGLTDQYGELELKEESIQFFRVIGGKSYDIPAWSSQPGYAESVMFDGGITLTFDAQLQPDTISGSTVTVTKNGVPVSGTTVSADANTVTIVLNQPVDYNCQYAVIFADGAKFAGNFRFPDLVFSTPDRLELTAFTVSKDGAEISAGTPIAGSTVQLQAELLLHTGSAARQTIVSLCVYDAAGRLICIGGKPVALTAGSDETVTARFAVPEDAGDCSIKCFVWESFASLNDIYEVTWR